MKTSTLKALLPNHSTFSYHLAQPLVLQLSTIKAQVGLFENKTDSTDPNTEVADPNGSAVPGRHTSS
jgi:hypothetical protein